MSNNVTSMPGCYWGPDRTGRLGWQPLTGNATGANTDVQIEAFRPQTPQADQLAQCSGTQVAQSIFKAMDILA